MGTVDGERTSFQDAMVGNFCFGCGCDNLLGLQIKSYWVEDSQEESVCFFDPESHHAAGPRHFVNGGIIATVIDCHAVCTAAADARRQGDDPDLWYATASMNLQYLRPTPIAGVLEVRARITSRDDRKTRLECRLIAGGKDCVTAEVVAVRVPPSWRDAQPAE